MSDGLAKTVKELTKLQEKYDYVVHPCQGGEMLSFSSVKKMVALTRELLFPGYFGDSLHEVDNLNEFTKIKLPLLHKKLQKLIYSSFCFIEDSKVAFAQCDRKNAENLSYSFLESLPHINEMLIKDVEATMKNDPAARSISEIIFAYPGLRATISHRIAHQLLKQGIPVLPRIISEMSHSNTGVDIHPGATIGEYFTLDHGTGTVIGETSIIGNNVTIYQGVTLGAKDFKADREGNLINFPRHPIVEDNVTIYAGAKILGRITIGKGSVIGGNAWITENVAPSSRVTKFS
ncbi:MAG: serine acetyltransferase [Prevotellaceae bacterium]|jgi:serine O-acetyltransferase|nr:serine acetyltransferase [Prevotellaceae bacterium]